LNESKTGRVSHSIDPSTCCQAKSLTNFAIRAWLGHVSLNTTNIYAEVDMEMKAKALATCEIRGTVPLKHWKEDPSLMQFLQAL
jgi:hypothetical protein